MQILLGKRGLSLQTPAAFFLAPRRKRRSFRWGEKRDDCIRRLMGALLDQLKKKPTKEDPCGCGSSFIWALEYLVKKDPQNLFTIT